MIYIWSPFVLYAIWLLFSSHTFCPFLSDRELLPFCVIFSWSHYVPLWETLCRLSLPYIYYCNGDTCWKEDIWIDFPLAQQTTNVSYVHGDQEKIRKTSLCMVLYFIGSLCIAFIHLDSVCLRPFLHVWVSGCCSSWPYLTTDLGPHFACCRLLCLQSLVCLPSSSMVYTPFCRLPFSCTVYSSKAMFDISACKCNLLEALQTITSPIADPAMIYWLVLHLRWVVFILPSLQSGN